MMGSVGTQGSTQKIINAVQKRIFVFKPLSIKADRGHIAHFLWGRLLRGYPSLEYITNDEKCYGNLTFRKPAQLGKPGSVGNFPVVHGIRPRHPDITRTFCEIKLFFTITRRHEIHCKTYKLSKFKMTKI